MGTKWIHLTDKLRYAGYLLIYLTAAAVSVFVRKRPAFRNLWLISERGVDAGDNGYHFLSISAKITRISMPRLLFPRCRPIGDSGTIGEADRLWKL